MERIWTLCGYPYGIYLDATISEDIERLERFNEFASVLLSEEVKTELKRMLASMMDRHLKKVRDARYPLSLSATKSDSMLRSEIKVCWLGTPMEQQLGFFEVDTVAQCGDSLKGEYLYSITLADVFTGWTVNISVKDRAHRNVVAGIQALMADLPYPMPELNFENGGEFIIV